MRFNINSHRLHQRDSSRRRRRRMERTNALLTMRNYFKLDLNINWEKFSVTKSCRSGREFTGKVCKFLAFFGSGKAAPERQNAAEQRHGACHKPYRNDLPSLRRTIILDNISCLMKASELQVKYLITVAYWWRSSMRLFVCQKVTRSGGRWTCLSENVRSMAQSLLNSERMNDIRW